MEAKGFCRRNSICRQMRMSPKSRKTGLQLTRNQPSAPDVG